MSYLIMECHEGYAVALTERGEFRKVANQGYEVGQTVPDALELKMSYEGDINAEVILMRKARLTAKGKQRRY